MRNFVGLLPAVLLLASSAACACLSLQQRLAAFGREGRLAVTPARSCRKLQQYR